MEILSPDSQGVWEIGYLKHMYYAVYDISDNAVRGQTILALKAQGFVRIQKSVFCAPISGQQKKDLLESVKMILSKSDSFYLLRSCSSCFGKLDVVGAGFDREYVAGKRDAMVL